MIRNKTNSTTAERPIVKAERFRANLLPYAIGQTPIKTKNASPVGSVNSTTNATLREWANYSRPVRVILIPTAGVCQNQTGPKMFQARAVFSSLPRRGPIPVGPHRQILLGAPSGGYLPQLAGQPLKCGYFQLRNKIGLCSVGGTPNETHRGIPPMHFPKKNERDRRFTRTRANTKSSDVLPEVNLSWPVAFPQPVAPRLG